MADILKVTTPAAGYENSSIKNNPNTGQNIHIQNPVDPSKVSRGDNRTDSGRDGNGQLAFQYDSNFGAFLHMLKNIPELSKVFPELFFAGEEAMLAGTMEPESAEQISAFFRAAQMDADGVLAFLKEQAASNARFGGGLFELLRKVMSDTGSVDLKAEVLDFIRKYNDMSSGDHILKNIYNCIKDTEGYIFRNYSEKLDAMLQELNMSAPPGETTENGALLKGKILPFLGRYISSTHDLGAVRGKISLLTVLISRYENGDISEVLQAFSRLTGYQGFRKFFGNMGTDQLAQVMENTDLEKEAGKTDFAQKFVDFIKMGVQGGAGSENKQVFQNMLQAMVMNESVYMPLIHLAFPLDIDGRMMFSEMWIDPDEEGSATEGGGKRSARIFVKFDIRDLGMFKLVVQYSEENASVQLYYPEQLQSFEGNIQKGMKEILQRNNLRVDSMYLQPGGGPDSPVQVFSKIQERKNSVDVRI